MSDYDRVYIKKCKILGTLLIVGIAVMLFGLWIISLSQYGTFFYAIGLATILFSASQLASLEANKKINEKLERIEKAMIELNSEK